MNFVMNLLWLNLTQNSNEHFQWCFFQVYFMKIFLSGNSAKNPLIIPNCIVHDNFFFQNLIVKKETFLSIIISIGLFKIIWVQHIKIYFLKLKLFFKKWQRKKKSECNHTHVVNGMFDFRAPQKDYPNSVHRFISFRQRKN